LIELLMVLTIIALLIGLLLAAIQRAREAANRATCANNLKEIGLAFHHFHGDHGYLPASRIWDHWATWAVQIMPYIEQDQVYQNWDITLQYYEQPAPIRAAQVKLYYCPSRRSPGELSVSGDVPDNGYPSDQFYPGALADYACSAGDFQYSGWLDGVNADGAVITGDVLEQPSYPIITRWQGRVSFARITDGTSNTLLVGEKHVPRSQWGVAPGDGSIYNGDHEWNFARIAGPGYPLASSPDDMTQWEWVFGSYHSGGLCQFVMADGSLRALPNSVDTTILGRLACRDDGLPIPDF